MFGNLKEIRLIFDNNNIVYGEGVKNLCSVVGHINSIEALFFNFKYIYLIFSIIIFNL